MSQSMLIDFTKCLGCNACTQACRMANGVREGTFKTKIHKIEIGKTENFKMVFAKHACKHCEDPACASACPVGALKKTEDGPVVYDATKCIGCRYCMNACPYESISYEWNRGLMEKPLISKCTFCTERVDGGTGPACAQSCPFGAITYGTRDEMLKMAKDRLKKYPDRYIKHIYGETEGGGTSILYLSNVEFSKLHMPEVPNISLTAPTEKIMKGTIPFAAGWTAVLTGLFAVFRLRDRGMKKNQENEE